MHGNRPSTLLTKSFAAVSEVRLTKTHARVRDLENDKYVAFQPAQQVIWNEALDKDHYGPTPCIISLSQPATLEVDFTYDSSLAGKIGSFSGSLASGPTSLFSFPSVTVVLDTNATKATAIVNIQGPTGGAPWGLQSKVDWQLEIDGQPVYLKKCGTFLQIFAVVDDLAPFFKTGIQLALLSWMLTPATTLQYTTLQSWVPYIVGVCFKSTFDPNVTFAQDPIHSYRYNSFGDGKPAFTNNAGKNFDLDDFLLSMVPPNLLQDWYPVNCYDMSAAVQVCLSLGIPYYYRDANGNLVNWVDPDSKDKTPTPMQNLGKAYIAPFGCMNQLDLIGWGDSNSPFFDNAAQKIVPPLANGQVDPKRDGFRNHAWVYYRQDKSDPNNVYALDACAGPVSTPLIMAEYIAKAVDGTASASNSRYPGVSKAKYSLHSGVQSVMVDGSDFAEATAAYSGDLHLRLTYQQERVFYNNVGPSDGYRAVDAALTSTNIQPALVPVTALLKNIADTAALALGETI